MPLPPGENPLEGHPKYEMLNWLGEGSFGFVLLARNLYTGEEVAIKFWPRGISTPLQNACFLIWPPRGVCVIFWRVKHVPCRLLEYGIWPSWSYFF